MRLFMTWLIRLCTAFLSMWRSKFTVHSFIIGILKNAKFIDKCEKFQI